MTDSAARGALLLLFDIAPDARAEHDRWHTHEHMPERLAIPGFLRGSRWVASTAGPRYCVLYEVAQPDVLDSAAYRTRLENPTPWTARIMRGYVGMRRTLCECVAQAGVGLGGAALVLTFSAPNGHGGDVDRWLADDVLPGLPSIAGVAGARLLRRAMTAAMTREQAIRGTDAAVDSALFVTGDDVEPVAALRDTVLAPAQFAARGATVTVSAVFRLAYVLSATDVVVAT